MNGYLLSMQYTLLLNQTEYMCFQIQNKNKN